MPRTQSTRNKEEASPAPPSSSLLVFFYPLPRFTFYFRFICYNKPFCKFPSEVYRERKQSSQHPIALLTSIKDRPNDEDLYCIDELASRFGMVDIDHEA